jgi:group I intron endonuclease
MREIITGVYSITNTVNGNKYVGSSVNIYRRWDRHRLELRQRKHKNLILQRAWDKYGEGAFVFDVLRITSALDLIKNEQHFIDSLRPKYNISPTAGNRLGCRHAEETKQKIRMSHIGLTLSDETREKLKNSHIGNRPTDETRAKMSASTLGAYRGWSNKPVGQFTKEGILVNSFDSIMDAERFTGIGNSVICRCCKGKRPTARGYVWKYI